MVRLQVYGRFEDFTKEKVPESLPIVTPAGAAMAREDAGYSNYMKRDVWTREAKTRIARMGRVGYFKQFLLYIGCYSIYKLCLF
jgi:hypothetical protein